MLSSRASLAVCLLVGGCLGDTNPCPVGQRPDIAADRCIPADAGPPALEPRCPMSDLDRWTEHFSGPGLVPFIQRCALTCGQNTPCIGACLGEAAGVTECADCVQASVDCAIYRCRSACSAGTDAECRACQCDAGCALAFDECAHVRLEPALCEGAHEQPADADPQSPPSPILVRRKSETGFTRATPFIPDAPANATPIASYAAAGWTDFVSFSLQGVEYLFASMSGCGSAHCLVRVSPVLADGALGPPPWEARWDVGWDVLTTFVTGEDVYLLQHKTGARPTTGAPRGSLRVHRLRAGADPTSLDVTLVHEDSWAFPTDATWSHIRGFALGETPHLLRYRSADERADAELLRVHVDGDALTFQRVSRDLGWAPGWDLIETFPVGDRWLVLQYAGHATESLPAGSARISALVPGNAGAVIVTPPLLTASWPADLTHLLPFRTTGASYLLRLEARSGDMDILGLPTDIPSWSGAGLWRAHAETWGASPAWDVITVVRARLWSRP